MTISYLKNFIIKTAETAYCAGAYAVNTARKHPLATAVVLLGALGLVAYTAKSDLFPFNSIIKTAEATNTQFAKSVLTESTPINPISPEKVSNIVDPGKIVEESVKSINEPIANSVKTAVSSPSNSRKSGSLLYRATKKAANTFYESVKTLVVMAPFHGICTTIAPKNPNAQNACLYIAAAAARAVIDYESELPFLSDYIGDPIEPEFPVPPTPEELYYQGNYQPLIY